MSIITKMIAQMKYKQSMKNLAKQLTTSVKLYEQNEKRIQELQELIKQDKAGSVG